MEEPASTTSSITSTSNTLTTIAPVMVGIHLPDGRMTPDMVSFLHALEAKNRHTFLKPHASIPAASLQLAKDTLDAFAPRVSDEQQNILKEITKKRKRKHAERPDVLKIRKLHIDGFQTPQVWQQARRVISSTLDLSKNALQELEDLEEVEPEEGQELVATNGQNGVHMMEFGEDGFEVATPDEELSSDLGDMEGVEFEELEENELEEEEDDSESGEDDFGGFSEGEDQEIREEEGEDDDEDEEGPVETFVEDADGLNDGFFSLEAFNKQTQWLEDQDARANPNTDAVDDEEQIDWHMNPMVDSKSKSKSKSKPKSKKEKNEEEEDRAHLGLDDDSSESEDEGGPTFGDMDLDAPEGASDDEDDGKSKSKKNLNGAVNIEDAMMGGLDLTANDIFYADFFDPPPKRVSKKQYGNPNRTKKKQPEKEKSPSPDLSDADMEKGISNTRRDLFDDLSERSDSEDALSDVSEGNPKSRRSAHERWQTKIGSEISKLEAASVGKRDWAMMGEAQAGNRPSNSLLETDLDWEFAGRRAPVATEETTADIAEIVKQRIVAREFDEIIRRRPESLDAGTKRGLAAADIDLTDGPRQGLADIYEEEWQKGQNPDTYTSVSDEKLKKDEEEVERMWKDLSGKLDALSSWHYQPRPQEAGLQVVSDIATVAMEDAQPTTAQGLSGMGGGSMLAPQEVYKAGQDQKNGVEIVGKDGLPVAREEMSRENKATRRRREKGKIRKAGPVGGIGGTNDREERDSASGVAGKGGKKGKKETVEQLRKGGVKVINRAGEIVDVDGKKARAEVRSTGATYRL